MFALTTQIMTFHDVFVIVEEIYEHYVPHVKEIKYTDHNAIQRMNILHWKRVGVLYWVRGYKVVFYKIHIILLLLVCLKYQ